MKSWLLLMYIKLYVIMLSQTIVMGNHRRRLFHKKLDLHRRFRLAIQSNQQQSIASTTDDKLYYAYLSLAGFYCYGFRPLKQSLKGNTS